MNQNELKIELVLIIAIALVALVILACVVCVRICNFCEQLRYLNMELERCSYKDREKWRQRRQDLWLNLFFPFHKK